MSSISKDLIIVAGAGKGIGFSIVENLLKNFPKITILALSRNIGNLTNLQKEFPNLAIHKSDLSNLTEKDKSEIVSISSVFSLRSLIFTAGVLEVVPIGKIDKNFFNSIYQNNVWSFIDLTQTIYPQINSNTHIVTISSMGGFTGTLKFNGLSTYSSSKSALACFTECLAEELKIKGASANCLSIGAVETEMMKTAFPNYKALISPETMANFIVQFTLFQKELFNGKVVPVSSTIP